jgi:3-oxoacyl-[acyl-carrier protein] reductase
MSSKDLSTPKGLAMDLGGRVALVTGGSRGIGRACCLMLARAGARVAVNYRADEKAAAGVAQVVREAGGEAIALRADVSDSGAAARLVQDSAARWGRLDIVVNNAAVWTDGAIESLDDDALAETIGVNLLGSFHVTRAAVPHLARSPSGGRLIFISSTAGQRGEAGHSHYAASKGALISLTKSLAAELAPRRVLVNCVAPGWVDTDMNDRPFAGGGRAAIEATIPLRRVGTPDEIGGAVVFLASDLATFITGEILNVNGGAVLCG